MIKTEAYGGGVRWHCTNCDTNKTSPGSTIPHIYWTAGKPPKVCQHCEPHKEYHIKLDFQVLLPEENEARVREIIDKAKIELAGAIRLVLGGRDAKLNKWTARTAHRSGHYLQG